MSVLRVWWFVVMLTAGLIRGDVQASFAVLPFNISAIAGETATLRCTVSNTTVDTVIYWSKGNTHFTFGMKILNKNVRSRYTLVGNLTDGDYDLRIENVKKSDAGEYECGYIGATGGKTSPPATVTVLVPPKAKYPLCNVQPQKEPSGGSPGSSTLWPGDGAEFTCQSSGGDPPASLQWVRANRSILDPQPSHIVYERILLPGDNGVEFTCVATSPALREPRTCTVMPMKVLPVVQVRPLTRMILPGDNATFHCEGSAIPHVASYSWRVAGRHVNDDRDGFSFANQKQLLTIHDVRSSHDQLEIACVASTPTGISASASVSMVVTPVYEPPVIPSKPTETGVTPEAPEDGSTVDEDGNEFLNIIDGDLFMIIITTFGALVILLLIVAVVMGCWALWAKGKRPQTMQRPRVEYHESTSNTIDMDPLPLSAQVRCETPTKIVSDPIMIVPTPHYKTATRTATESENAPGFLSQLYSTLDGTKLPARTVFTGFPEKPVASITPTQGVAATLPRRIDKPTGEGKPFVKECPKSFTIDEKKDPDAEDDDDLKK